MIDLDQAVEFCKCSNYLEIRYIANTYHYYCTELFCINCMFECDSICLLQGELQDNVIKQHLIKYPEDFL